EGKTGKVGASNCGDERRPAVRVWLRARFVIVSIRSVSISALRLIHMFFTSAIISPAERLQTRNPIGSEQGKIPTLFCATEQKNLDAKSCLAGEHFPPARPN